MSKSRNYVIVLPDYFKPTLRNLPEYTNWSAIKSRCTNKKFDKKKRYVWRGITMCERWRFGENGISGFECFLLDMGRRPTQKHTVERKDNDGNYEPSNCKWATNKEQSNNRSNNHRLDYKGERLSMMATAEKYGISYFVLRDRVMRNWPIKEAIETPAIFGWKRPGKSAKGVQLPQSRLTEKLVKEIRQEYADKKTSMHKIAARLNMSVGAICLMINRKTWAHIP